MGSDTPNQPSQPSVLDGSYDSLPAVFGRYLLLRRLSQGGMGEIFIARVGEIQGFEKPIVIKKILPALARDQEFLRLFVEEAQIAIKLNHSNIATVYEVGMVDGGYFLAMEYVEGRDLRAILERAQQQGFRVPMDVALFLVREVANALAYAHRRTDEEGQPLNLVHCDISPPNVLVSYEGDVKIIDFGVARSAMQTQHEEVSFGKFGYMAPEQLLKGAVIDRRADIYSTGVVLYELLTGHRLFFFPPDVDHREMIRTVTAGKIRPPSSLDTRLAPVDQLVMRALHSDPDQRYGTAEELRDAVQQHLYRINPTASADNLAATVRELFGEEVGSDQKMLLAASQTDLMPFQNALNDASSQTVSYALGREFMTVEGLEALRAGAGLSLDKVAPVPQLVPPRSGSARRTPATTAPRGAAVVGATRPLSPTERRAAVGVPLATGVVPKQTGRGWLVALTVGLVAVALATTIALWPDKPPPEGARASTASSRLVGAHSAKREEAGTDAALVVVVSDKADAGSAAPSADAERSVLVRVVKRPVVRKRRARRPRKTRGRTRRGRKGPSTKRGASGKGKTATGVSASRIQRKFVRVRREYVRFSKAYGRRFDREWQRILFAHTYGKKDKAQYERLDRMLDELLQKMREVGGP